MSRGIDLEDGGIFGEWQVTVSIREEFQQRDGCRNETAAGWEVHSRQGSADVK